MNTARTLANYNHARKGYQSCMCPMCWQPGSRGRKAAKNGWNRAIRRSETAQIRDTVNAESDRDGDASFTVYVSQLTIINARNLRSVNWNY